MDTLKNLSKTLTDLAANEETIKQDIEAKEKEEQSTQLNTIVEENDE